MAVASSLSGRQAEGHLAPGSPVGAVGELREECCPPFPMLWFSYPPGFRAGPCVCAACVTRPSSEGSSSPRSWAALGAH